MLELKTINSALAFLGRKLDAILDAVRSTPQKVSIDIAEQTKESLHKEVMEAWSSVLDQMARVAAKKEFRVDIDLTTQEALLQKLLQAGDEHSRLLREIIEKKPQKDNSTEELLGKNLKELRELVVKIKPAQQESIKGVLDEIKSAIKNIRVSIPSDVTINAKQFKELAASVRLGGGGTQIHGESNSNIRTGRQTSSTPGTAVQLSSTPDMINKIVVQAIDTNQNLIVVGDSSVVAASGSVRGTMLMPGDAETIYVDDLQKVYIDVRASGDGVTYTAYS